MDFSGDLKKREIVIFDSGSLDVVSRQGRTRDKEQFNYLPCLDKTNIRGLAILHELHSKKA